ncbi:hypothetical protein P691DRAFT_787680 [Macrolepiota fuliginosa MF-IS2]|uniref:F-box domain-containing protein n=1 Tax=Macrolepiota fuliginosa MF-IS2 TaxID=1400762 RepID=A0A9P5XPI4_9AGAR|nr:hypothetical protein P691DRAFT_787680 [Macrolepiota fuliginosa MF-IS2]
MGTLSDLPTEILEQVIVHLNDAMLLRAAQVNQRLNSVALSEFFKRHNVFRYKSIVVDSPHGETMTTLRALCMAVWIKHVPLLIFHINPGIPDLFDEVYGLTVFIDQLEHFGSLDLHIGFGTWREVMPPTSHERMARGQHWRDAFFSLLEIVLLKGTQRLYISDRQKMQDYLEMDQDGLPSVLRYGASLRRLGGWIIKKGRGIVHSAFVRGLDEEVVVYGPRSPRTMIKRWGSNRSTVINAGCITPSVPRVLGLEQLLLSSPSLISPLFFSRTLSMFRGFAGTLRILSISYETRDQHRWATMLEQIELPRLDYLYCHGIGTHPVDPPMTITEMIILFISRHPSLTNLEVRNLPPLLNPPESTPVLPNLRSLIAHATFTKFLLQNPDNCHHLDKLFILPQIPSDAPHPTSTDYYSEVDTTLSLIASFTPGAIQLQLYITAMPDALNWMNEHIRLDSTSVLRRLARVRHLTVWVFPSTPRVPEGPLLEVLPGWLALFPSLEVLYVGVTGTQVFYDEVVGLCPQLRAFDMGDGKTLPVIRK